MALLSMAHLNKDLGSGEAPGLQTVGRFRSSRDGALGRELVPFVGILNKPILELGIVSFKRKWLLRRTPKEPLQE